MIKKLFVASLVLIALGIYIWPEKTPQAPLSVVDPDSLRQTTAGPVIGYADANNTYAWLGIPFASPPVNELRWVAPRLPQPWQAPRESLDFSSPCVQLWGPLAGMDGDTGDVVGNEDCLYLNVWSPRKHSDHDDTPLPVMFWIHGGGNTIGTANTYPGDLLAGGENVVVVTINYRLGLFGWLTHPALRANRNNMRDASGNYGNLDMIRALEWVQNNIANFGGNPSNVTIFGESAGGRNAYSLMASPLAKGLFHKVIAQSGSTGTTPLWRAENYTDDEQPGAALSSREWLLKQLQIAGKAENRIAAKVFLEQMSDQEVLSFMHSRSAAELMSGLSGGAGMFSAPQSFRDGNVLPLDSLPSLFRNVDNYNSVPLMTGTNKDEVKLFMAQSPEFVERRFWLFPRIKDLQAYNSAAAYFTDNWKASAVDEVATTISASGAPPVYAYRWDWDEGGKNWMVDYSTLIGAGHGLEVSYIFDAFDDGIVVPGLYNEINIPGRDKLATQMRSYWSNFATTGSPDRGRDGDLPEWTAWSESITENMMILDTDAGGGLRMTKQPMTTAMLKQRVAQDTAITDKRSRCALYAALFLKPNAGDPTWDQAGYNALGCSGFDPWQLETLR